MTKVFKEMDAATFGGSQGAINLVTILNEIGDPKISSRVSRLLGRYLSSTDFLMYIPEKSTRQTVLGLWHKRFIEVVNTSDLPKIVKTHTLCVGVTRHRQLREEGVRSLGG